MDERDTPTSVSVPALYAVYGGGGSRPELRESRKNNTVSTVFPFRTKCAGWLSSRESCSHLQTLFNTGNASSKNAGCFCGSFAASV